jgi:hypothetical protein
MAEEHHARAALFLLRQKSAAQFRLNAKQRHQVPGDYLGLHVHRPLHAGEREGGVVIRDELREAVILLAPVEVVGIGHILPIEAMVG